MAEYNNHLIYETSPYLLQHAHNPVDWFPWGEEALRKAKEEDKPILVSIGYSACHWCHVMEKESFEDAETAAIMNEYFVNIKIDREERPDLDHIYMNALQTMAGNGGWPLNVFLTPDKKPFYGGTYYPPEPVYNRPSWKQVLVGVIEAFNERRDKLENTAQGLTEQLIRASNFEIRNAGQLPGGDGGGAEHMDTIFRNMMQSADMHLGGFGAAPKFPQTFCIRFLLSYYYATGNKQALQQAELSLQKMIYGGIYDQVGGGFARYSTDAEWLAPHFEKMLYDNALLVIAMSEAYQLTKRDIYKETIVHTLDFVLRELTGNETSFYAALDADSEGVEGKFYVWSKKEIEDTLGADAKLFCAFFDVTEEGNWEHNNILRVIKPPELFAAEWKTDPLLLQAKLKQCLDELLRKREERVRPGLDDKILLSWNALMNTAFSKAYAATGITRYKEVAINNMDFLLARFYNKNTGKWNHVYKNGISKTPAFLDDYANLIQALITLQEITGNQVYLEQARRLTELVDANFQDPETGYYFYTHQNQQDVIIRTKETYDGATPSSNAIMAWNLRYLSLIFDNREWRKKWMEMVTSIASMVIKYPVSFGVWAGLLFDYFNKASEIAIVGERYTDFLPDVLAVYLPGRVLQSAANANASYPLLKDRGDNTGNYIYYCKDYICEMPVSTVPAFMQLIDRKEEDKAKKAQ